MFDGVIPVNRAKCTSLAIPRRTARIVERDPRRLRHGGTANYWTNRVSVTLDIFSLLSIGKDGV